MGSGNSARSTPAGGAPALLALSALLLALVGCSESPAPMPRTGPVTNFSAFTAQPLWLAAWAGPPARDAHASASADAWRTFRADGFEFVIAPVSDAGAGAAPDTAGPAPRGLMHDRRLSLDAARGADWPAGVRAAVRAGQGTAGLAGYFVADEPRPGELDRLARLTAAIAQADSLHPAWVDLAGLPAQGSHDTARRWIDHVVRLVRRGRLAQFAVSVSPFSAGVETGSYLATLNAAALVSARTNVPFGVVLPFTPTTAAQARYLAEEAVIHGARGIAWRVDWPPARRDTLAAINGELLTLARWLPAANELQHYGADLAADSSLGALFESRWIEEHYVYEFGGGPATVVGRWGEGRSEAWAVVNRDWAHARTFVLRWHEPDPRGRWVLDLQDPQKTWRLDPDTERTHCTIQPGGAVLIRRGLGPAPRD